MPQPSGPFAVVIAVIGAFWLWTWWRRPGMLRREWVHGRGLQRSAVVVATLASLGFLVGLALGQVPVVLGSWLVGGLAGLVLLLTGRADGGLDAGRGPEDANG